METENLNQVIIVTDGQSFVINTLPIGQKAYLTDENSFVDACKNGELDVIKYLLNLGNKYNLLNGFDAAMKSNQVIICKELLNLIDIKSNDFGIINKTVTLGNLEILDLLFSKILPEDIEAASRIAFDRAILEKKINILDYIFEKGYFWKTIRIYKTNHSALYSSLLGYGHNYSSSSDSDFTEQKKMMIETYKWLEKHGASIEVDEIDEMFSFIIDPIICKLILASIEKSINLKDEIIKQKYSNTILTKIHSLIYEGNQIMIEEFIKLGVSPQLFFNEYINSISLKNFDILFFLLENGAVSNNENNTIIIINLIKDNLIDQLDIFLTKLNINLRTFDPILIKQIIKKAISSANLKTNQHLHNLVNYPGYYSMISVNIQSMFTKILSFDDKENLTENIIDSIYQNKDVINIMNWLVSLGYNINKEIYCKNLRFAMMHLNIDYVIYGLNKGIVTATFLKKHESYDSKIQAIIDSFQNQKNINQFL